MEVFPQAQGADADPRSHALLVETVRELEQELRGRDLSLESQQITIEKQQKDLESLQALCAASPEAQDDVRDSLLRENDRLQQQLSRLGNGVTGASVAAELQLDMMQRARRQLSLQLQALKPLNDQYARLLEKDAPVVAEEDANDDFVQGELTRFKLYNHALYGVLERRDRQLRALLDIHAQLRQDKFDSEARLEAMQRTDPFSALAKEQDECEQLRRDLKQCKTRLAQTKHSERTAKEALQAYMEEQSSSSSSSSSSNNENNNSNGGNGEEGQDGDKDSKQLRLELADKEAVLRDLSASLATLTARMEAQGQGGELEKMAAERTTTLGRTRADLIRLQTELKSARANEAAAVAAKNTAQNDAAAALKEARKQHAVMADAMQDRLDAQTIAHAEEVEALQEVAKTATDAQAKLEAQLEAAQERGEGAERCAKVEAALSKTLARQAEGAKLLSVQLTSLQTGLAELAEALPGSPRKRRQKVPRVGGDAELFDAEFLSTQLDTLSGLAQRMRGYVHEAGEKEQALRTRAATSAARAAELDGLSRAKQGRIAGLEEDLVKLQAALRDEQRARAQLQREGRLQRNSKLELDKLEVHVHALERVLARKSDMIRDLEVVVEKELGWSAAEREHALGEMNNHSAPVSRSSSGRVSLAPKSPKEGARAEAKVEEPEAEDEDEDQFSAAAGAGLHTHGMSEEDELAMLQRELEGLRQC